MRCLKSAVLFATTYSPFQIFNSHSQAFSYSFCPESDCSVASFPWRPKPFVCSTWLSLWLSFYRIILNASEDISFFTSHSPPSSPRPCPISPCRSGSNSSLSMENDYVDFNMYVNKVKKPFSPARKRLNMEEHVIGSQGSPTSKSTDSLMSMERNYLQSINQNVKHNSVRASPSGTYKRAYCVERPVQVHSKRLRSENQSPSSAMHSRINQQPRNSMNLLASSSETLRKNRL